MPEPGVLQVIAFDGGPRLAFDPPGGSPPRPRYDPPMTRPGTPLVVALLTGALTLGAPAEVRAQASAPVAPAAAPAAAIAPAPPRPERLVVDWGVDVPVTLATGAFYLGLSLGESRQPLSIAAPAKPPGGLDGLAVLTLHPAPARAADILLGATLALAFGADVVDGWHDGIPWNRVMLYAETIMVVGAVTEATKWVVRRPRPYTYTKRLGIPDDDLSFFSGHTSNTAAAAFTLARTLDLTHDLGLGGRVLVYGGATALTAVVGVLRVVSGKHFPSDVIVGACVGGAIGFLVPELHRAPGLMVAAAPTADGGFHLTLAARF